MAFPNVWWEQTGVYTLIMYDITYVGYEWE